MSYRQPAVEAVAPAEAGQILAVAEGAGPIVVGGAAVTYVESAYRTPGAENLQTVYAASATPIAEGAQQ
jgi:hypothetical protein